MTFRRITHAVKRPATGNILPLHFVYLTTFCIVTDFIAVCITLRTHEKSIRGLRWHVTSLQNMHWCILAFICEVPCSFCVVILIDNSPPPLCTLIRLTLMGQFDWFQLIDYYCVSSSSHRPDYWKENAALPIDAFDYLLPLVFAHYRWWCCRDMQRNALFWFRDWRSQTLLWTSLSIDTITQTIAATQSHLATPILAGCRLPPVNIWERSITKFWIKSSRTSAGDIRGYRPGWRTDGGVWESVQRSWLS